MKRIQVSNEAECKKCGDHIFSGGRHDFKSCKCGAISIDGGLEYTRWVGNLDDINDRSMSMPEDAFKAMKDAVAWGQANGRNEFGIGMAVIRALRDHGLLNEEAFKWPKEYADA